MKSNRPGLKGYPSSAAAEIEAVDALQHYFDKRFVKPFINKLDRVPNHDGHIDITTGDGKPYGEFRVQVKKAVDKSKPYKYPVEITFINYCCTSQLAVLLFVVDTGNDVAYWMHIDDSVTKKLAGTTKKTVVLSCPRENIISKKDTGYVDKFMTIIDRENTKKLDFNRLRKENEGYKKQNEELLHHFAERQAGPDARFSYIHRFLDYYNRLLDIDFLIVKKAFYHEVWKLGFAVDEYSEQYLSFVLFPVYYFYNDTQIKFINSSNDHTIRSSNTFSHFHKGNPIIERMESYAFELIRNDTIRLIKNKYLLILDEIVASETLTGFIDDYSSLLNLPANSPHYTVTEIENGINIYLRHWLEEAGRWKPASPFAINDLDDILFEYLPNEIDEISIRANKKIDNNEPLNHQFQVECNYGMAYIQALLNWLKNREVKSITRLLRPRIYPPGESYFPWELLSEQDIQANLTAFFSHFPQVYDNIARAFFPAIFKDINFYHDFSRLLIFASPKNISAVPAEGYQISYIYLENTGSETQNSTTVYFTGRDETGSEGTQLKRYILDTKGQPFEWQGSQYKLLRFRSPQLLFIFEKRPFYNQLYQLLEINLERYFARKTGVKHAAESVL